MSLAVVFVNAVALFSASSSALPSCAETLRAKECYERKLSHIADVRCCVNLALSHRRVKSWSLSFLTGSTGFGHDFAGVAQSTRLTALAVVVGRVE